MVLQSLKNDQLANVFPDLLISHAFSLIKPDTLSDGAPPCRQKFNILQNRLSLFDRYTTLFKPTPQLLNFKELAFLVELHEFGEVKIVVIGLIIKVHLVLDFFNRKGVKCFKHLLGRLRPIIFGFQIIFYSRAIYMGIKVGKLHLLNFLAVLILMRTTMALFLARRKLLKN